MVKFVSVSKRIFLISTLAVIGFTVSVLVHEFGHVLGAKLSGHRVLLLHIWPGFQLIPDFGQPVQYDWPNGAIAVTQVTEALWNQTSCLDISHLLSDNWKMSLIPLLGSVSTWLISLVFLSILYFLKPKGLWFAISLTGAFFYYDIFTYVLFPYFFGLPHLIFIGATYSEPVMALSGLGMHTDVSAVIIVIVCSIQTFLLVKLLEQR